MKKQLMTAVCIVALSVFGCKDKPKEMPSAPVPQGDVSSQQMPMGGSPHGTVMPGQAGAAGHKGKVVATMDAGGYTYLQVEEKGQKIWAAAAITKLSVGDEVEFPDSSAMLNFTSPTLKRTFDKILFISSLRVNGK
ncbi:MAG: hypothetical protein WA121_10295 [Syntrophales bacterium]